MTKSLKNIIKKGVSKNLVKQTFIVLLLTFLVFILLLVGFNLYFANRTHPNVSVGGVAIGGLTKLEALKLLHLKIESDLTINLNVKESQIQLSLTDIDFSQDLEKSIDEAVLINKSSNKLTNLFTIPNNLFTSSSFPLVFNFNQNKLNEYLTILGDRHAVAPIPYKIELKNGEIIIDKGKKGEVANTENLKSEILNLLAFQSNTQLELKFTPIDETLNETQTTELTKRGVKLIGKNIILEHEYDSFILPDSKLISFLSPNREVDKNKLVQYLNEYVISKVERSPQDATLVFKDQKVEEFSPAKDGVKVETSDLFITLTNKLDELEISEIKSASIKIPIDTTPPNIVLTDINNLGIKEMIGRGVSYFKGSIPSRIFNVGHAAVKFKSILVAPNEVFSFNSVLGDVSALTGFKQAYIIKNGRTVLGDGGGICQVSTTLFRAVLNAGLPVIERRAHSYRVGYYEQASPVGLDATVFYPTTDFKFKNDTPGHLLIQSTYNPKQYSLVFEIYGTNDGRISTVYKSIISSSTPPPEDLYVDDPTLTIGQTKQIDQKAWGARVSFKYHVEREGEILIDKNFISNYQPWQSVFLRGTAPGQN